MQQSTADYCGMNPGLNVGTTKVSSLIFVDDIMDINGSHNAVSKAHDKAILFAKTKKLEYSQDNKCKVMTIKKNSVTQELSPSLFINGLQLSKVSTMCYLGDVFNERGNHKDLIEDRVARGIGRMVSIAAMVTEMALGVYTIESYVLLYKTLFLPCVLFNAQAWTNITKAELNPLVVL